MKDYIAVNVEEALKIDMYFRTKIIDVFLFANANTKKWHVNFKALSDLWEEEKPEIIEDLKQMQEMKLINFVESGESVTIFLLENDLIRLE